MEGLGQLVARAGAGRGALEVYESAGRRWLQHATGVLQSAMEVAAPWRPVLPYTRAMLAGLALLDDLPRHAVVLGLGGGALVRFLRHCLPRCRILAVEHDPGCVALAREHFELDAAGPGLEVVVDDAREALPRLGARADLLLVDLFDAGGMPAWLGDAGFHRACARSLRPGGVIAVNLWIEPDDEALAAVDALEDGLGHPCLLVPVAGYRNVIGLARGDGTPLPDIAGLEARARRTARRLRVEPCHLFAAPRAAG